MHDPIQSIAIPAESLERLLAAAACGDPDANAAMGYLYENGIAVKQDIEKAVSYYESAAEQRHPIACCNLGSVLYRKRAFAEAVDAWHVALSIGCHYAFIGLGLASEHGNGMSRDLSRAYDYFCSAAEAGLIDGLLLKARCLRDGTGVKRNVLLARETFEKAAQQGSGIAYFELATGIGDGVFETLHPIQRAAEYFRAAAELGYRDGLAAYGECLAMGIGVEKNIVEGRRYLERAIDANASRAKYVLSLLVLRQHFADIDEKVALRWLQESAEDGEPGAQYMLGRMYEIGDRVTKDTSKASQLFELAAAQGHVRALAKSGEVKRVRKKSKGSKEI